MWTVDVDRMHYSNLILMICWIECSNIYFPWFNLEKYSWSPHSRCQTYSNMVHFIKPWTKNLQSNTIFLCCEYRNKGILCHFMTYSNAQIIHTAYGELLWYRAHILDNVSQKHLAYLNQWTAYHAFIYVCTVYIAQCTHKIPRSNIILLIRKMWTFYIYVTLRSVVER